MSSSAWRPSSADLHTTRGTGYPPATAVQAIFGDLHSARRACGYDGPPRRSRFHAADAIDALRNFHQVHGRNPSVREWHELDQRPSAPPIIRHFGSWNAALSAAGLIGSGGSGSGGTRLAVDIPDAFRDGGGQAHVLLGHLLGAELALHGADGVRLAALRDEAFDCVRAVGRPAVLCALATLGSSTFAARSWRVCCVPILSTGCDGWLGSLAPLGTPGSTMSTESLSGLAPWSHRTVI